jgi:hypothetical protein
VFQVQDSWTVIRPVSLLLVVLAATLCVPC